MVRVQACGYEKALQTSEGSMADLGAIAGMMTALRGVSDLGRAALELRDAEMMRNAIIKMQGAILDAQQTALSAREAQAELLEQISSMKAELQRVGDWEKEAARYRLTDYGSGTYAYALVPEAANGEPDHRLCPNCFNLKKKSILQFQFQTADSRQKYQCLSCSAEYNFGVARRIEYAPARTRKTSWMED